MEKNVGKSRIKAVVLALVFFAAALAAQRFVAMGIGGSIFGMPLGELVFYIGLSVLAAVLCSAQGMGAAELKLTKKRVGFQILWGAGLAALLTAVFVGGALLLGYAPRDFLAEGASDIPTLIADLFFLAVIVSPLEEFWFHGFLESSAARTGLPAWACITAVALLFGILHLTGGGGLVNFAVCAGIALCFGWCMHRFSDCTLLSVILAHSFYNIVLELIRYTYCN